jgi:hypothetical protein
VFHVKPNAECRTSHAADVLRVYVPDPTTLDPLAPPKPMAAGVAFRPPADPGGHAPAFSGATADVASLAPCALFHVKWRAA